MHAHKHPSLYIPLVQLQYQTQVSAASSTSQSTGEDFDDDEEDDGYYQDDDYNLDEDDDIGFENGAKTKETCV